MKTTSTTCRRAVLASRLLAGASLAWMPILHAAPFSPPSVIWAGEPDDRHLLTGDINSDKLPDVAVVSGGTNLLWFVNTGGGNFTASHSLGVAGWRIAAAQVADLNADGHADVILVLRDNANYYGIGQLAVFRNNGGTGFTKTQQFATGGFPAYGNPFPLAADLDNDGDPDLAFIYCPNYDDGVLVWCKNNGSGTLAGAVTLDSTTNSTDLYWADSLLAGDLNGDGKTDLVVTARQNGTTGTIQSAIRAYTGIGQGSFGAPLRTLEPFGRAARSFLADLNRDGRPDLLSMHDAPAKDIWLRLNSGAGFGAETAVATTTAFFSRDSAAGDVDADGDADIVFTETNGSTRRLMWLRNHGSGQFQAAAPLATGSNGSGRVARTLDADGDGDLDAMILTDSGLEIALNQSIRRAVEPAFTNVNRASVLNGEPRLVAADFDRDGETDLAALSPDDGTVRWMPANGNALGAEVTVSTAAAGGTAIAAGDLTGDGLPDLVVGMPALGQIHLLRNVGNGASWQTSVLPALAAVHAIAVADGDLDGSLDVIAFSRSTYKTVMFRNVNRDGSSWTQEQVASLAAVDQILPVQLVKPGRPEFLLTTYDPEVGICQCYRALWNGSAWGTALLAQGNSNSSVVAAGDLNGDGSNDLLRSLGYGAGWQPNYNNGALNPAQGIPSLPEGQRCGTLADVNGDGRPDLVTAGAGKVLASIHLGNGSFAAPLTLFTAPGEAFRDVLAFDFERDGDLDLAVADAGADRVRVLINRAGQYDAVSTAPQSGQVAWGAEEKSLIHTSVSHVGVAGDASLAVKNLLVRLQRAVPQANGTFTHGSALTAVEAGALLEKIEVFRDLGSQGVYEPGTDVPVAVATSFAGISDGHVTLAAADSPQLRCGPGQTLHFIIRAKARATAGGAGVSHLAATLVMRDGSLVAHHGSSPVWPLRKRGATGHVSAVLGFVQPTPLQSWRMSYFGTHEDAGAAANDADPNGNGVPNIVEYLMSRDPKGKGGIGSSVPVDLTQRGAQLPALVDLRLRDTYDSKIRLTLEYTATLTSWHTLASRTGTGAWTGVQPTGISLAGGRTRWTFNSGLTPAAVPRLFYRLRVEELP
jgi:hypothetical protein